MEEISIREFSRRLGCSDTAIHKAIKTGRIIKGFNVKTKRIIPEIATEEYRNNTNPNQARVVFDGKKLPANLPKVEKKTIAQADSQADLQSKHYRPISSDADINTARKADMVYKAKLRELEYKQKTGSLVEKEAVYRELFRAGKELRTALMSIPDQIIDDVLACNTRNEAHALLSKTIAQTLEMLSDIENRKISA